MSVLRVAEYLNVDLATRHWHCVVCNHDLGSAERNYKESCLVAARDPREVHNPGIEAKNGFVGLAPNPAWCRIVEFYCPGCVTLMEAEYLPPGHPITHDIALDLDSLERRFGSAAQEEA